MQQKKWMIYGSTGYTGRLLVEQAKRKGMRPILAGRNEQRLKELAQKHQLPYRAFSLEDPEEAKAFLKDLYLVFNTATPFEYTQQALTKVCLDLGIHYLDISGDVDDLKRLESLHQKAKEQDIMLMPGVGFAIAPTDLLAQHLHQRMPDAVELSLATAVAGGVSKGSFATFLKRLTKAGYIRKDRKLLDIIPKGQVRLIDLGRGKEWVTLDIQRGDLLTAWYSTAIPNIRCYYALPGMMSWLVQRPKLTKWLLSTFWMRWLVKKMLKSMPFGPDAQERAKGHSWLWGEVKDVAGNTLISRFQIPEAYNATAHIAIKAVEQVLQAQLQVGFATPAQTWGNEWLLEEEGFSIKDEQKRKPWL